MVIQTIQQVYVGGQPQAGEPTLSYVGRVVAVEQHEERRNHSDTLDYSDWRWTSCTTALVYEGRVAAAGSWDPERYCTRTSPEELPVWKRFRKVDCTNVFAWRGADFRTAVADADLAADPEMAEDLAAWNAGQILIAMVSWSRRCESSAKERARKAQEELDRPVVGKKMVVKSGRKVPVGTEGTVAFIHHEGRVLLKPDAVWQDRKADGVWVEPRHLKAR